MQVSLITKTNADSLSVRVTCDEIWTAVNHIDDAIKTLQVARRWMFDRKKEAVK